MNTDEIKSFCDAWIEEEPTPEERASGEYDGFDIELRGCFLSFSHAGRYSLVFGNQGFNTGDFGKGGYDEDGKQTCPFYSYVTSPDVCYYDGEFKTESRPAYDVALYREDFSHEGSFNELSDELGRLFASVRARDYVKLGGNSFRQNGITFDKTGKIVVDGAALDVNFAVTVLPRGKTKLIR